LIHVTFAPPDAVHGLLRLGHALWVTASQIYKAQIQAKIHKNPAIRFEDQKLTSFSGLLIFQALFMRMNIRSVSATLRRA